MLPEVDVRVWGTREVEALARHLEAGAELAGPTLRSAAAETAFALRCASQALEWVDETDIEVLRDVVDRLDALEIDAGRILAAIADNVETSSEEERTVVRRYAPPPPPSEEPTVVRPVQGLGLRRRTPPKLNAPRLARAR